MLVSVLLVEVTGRPLTVAAASAAVWLCVIRAAPAEGSKVSIDRPVASPLPPSSSVTVVRKAFSAPVALERIRRREPLESVITSAVTPAPAALILSRMSARVSVAATAMSIGVASAFAVKLVWPVPQVPSSMRSVPPPRAVPAGCTPVARVCTLASFCTSTE